MHGVGLLLKPPRDPDDSPRDMVAHRIERHRKGRGMTLKDLADKVGLDSPSYIWAIEKGKKVPTVDLARKLARALGDDEELFVAWARAGREKSEERRTLNRLIADPRVKKGYILPEDVVLESTVQGIFRRDAMAMASPSSLDASTQILRRAQSAEQKLIIPILREGQDPRARSATFSTAQ